MKKNNLLIIVATIIIGMTFGSLQGESGIKAGIDLSRFDLSKKGFQYPDMAKEDDSTYALMRIGIFHNFKLSESFGVQAELYFVQKGSKLEGLDGGSKGKSKYKISYLELPILAKYSVPLGGANFYFLGGAYTALRLDTKFEETQKIEGQDISEGDFKNFDMGLTVGLGGSIEVNPVDIILEARYNHGLLNINDVKNSDIKVRNRSFSFMVGVGF